jgi:16S rRNA (cytosine1402-N4)-methyltransferase
MTMHVPVMKTEVLEALAIQSGEWYLDGTFGRGGHTSAMLEAGAKVVALDHDPDAITAGKEKFAEQIAAGTLILISDNFANLSRALEAAGHKPTSFAGCLFDFGMSSNQLEESGRGFSFQKDEPLDMRMNPELGVTAADLVNALPEKHLKSLFWDYAQETSASAIARGIVTARQVEPIKTTSDLVQIVQKAKHTYGKGHLHPATKVFMALRMAVNMELDNIALLFDQLLMWMKPGATLVFLSFHEGEDRLVKQQLRTWEQAKLVTLGQKKPLGPSEQEIADNPRSRSTKLRSATIL